MLLASGMETVFFLTQCEHLPHQDAVGPHVTLCCVTFALECFLSRPPYQVRLLTGLAVVGDADAANLSDVVNHEDVTSAQLAMEYLKKLVKDAIPLV